MLRLRNSRPSLPGSVPTEPGTGKPAVAAAKPLAWNHFSGSEHSWVSVLRVLWAVQGPVHYHPLSDDPI